MPQAFKVDCWFEDSGQRVERHHGNRRGTARRDRVDVDGVVWRGEVLLLKVA